jgi:hypothetical protein
MSQSQTRPQLPPSWIEPAAARVLFTIDRMLAAYFWEGQLRAELEKVLQGPDVLNGVERAILDGSMAAMRAFSNFVRPPKNLRKDDLFAMDFPGLRLTQNTIPHEEKKIMECHLLHLTQLGLPLNSARTAHRKWLAILLAPAIEFCSYVEANGRFSEELRQGAASKRSVCEHVLRNPHKNELDPADE